MSHRFTYRFVVRQHELDAFHHVNNVVHVQHMQEAAIQASTQAGYGPEWYRARGAGWVIRQLTIRYHAQTAYGEEIEIETWLSQMRGVSCLREYDLKRSRDGARVARARAQWIYVDLVKGSPLRIPADFLAAFTPADEVEDLGVRLQKAEPTNDAHRYRTRRRVQFHELDIAHHVNHAAYLHWIGQAYFDALSTAGYPLERGREEGWLVFQGGHDMEYFAPARDHDEIEIVSWVCEIAKVRGAWTHEIYHAGNGELLARDYSLGVFVTPEGRPTALPAPAVQAVLRGPPANAEAPPS